jgi:hypothetical protein
MLAWRHCCYPAAAMFDLPAALRPHRQLCWSVCTERGPAPEWALSRNAAASCSWPWGALVLIALAIIARCMRCIYSMMCLQGVRIAKVLSGGLCSGSSLHNAIAWNHAILWLYCRQQGIKTLPSALQFCFHGMRESSS